MPKVLTTCVYCGCGCGLYLDIEKDKVVGVTPSFNHPVSRGRLCVKGFNVHEFIHSDKRLKKPLIKKNGKFVETSWDNALSIVAKRLKEIKKKHGADSIACLSSAKCTNEENYIMQKFARAAIGTNNVDHCARLCHSSTVAGLAMAFGSGAMTNSIDEIENADVILITGSNTSEQHPLIATRVINAVKKGAKLIIIDPRKLFLSNIAHLSLQQRPGTDVAWINGLMHVIIEEALEDKNFIKERTEDYEKLKKTVKRYTPEKVSKITGIEESKIIEVARLYGKADKASIIFSMGITQHTTGTDNVLSLANLAMLTGNVGKESTGVNPLRGQNNVQGACDVGALYDVYSGYQKVADESSRDKFSKAWNVKLPDKQGLSVVEIFNNAWKGKVNAIYVMGENPIISDPDANHVAEALKKVDFLVVQDIFLSETAELADVVLPSASFAEKDGTYTNTERRVQLVKKAIDPVGQSRSDWEIICDVASRMGYKMGYKNSAEIMDEIASLTPIYAGIGHERLTNWGLQWPVKDKKHNGTKFLHKDNFTRGKGKFHAVEFKEPNELPNKKYPYILTTGRILEQWHTRTMTGKSATLDREEPFGYVEISPEDAKALEIKNGWKIKVSSRRGSIEPIARVTDSAKPGVIFIPFHYKEAAANKLTNPALDPIAKIPEYKVCAVRIDKI
ncbi:MAG: Formate dehydrogenase, alpha subunit [Candidatus Nomurabacteria bacterium GW2011_GWA2_40_9]|uniref:Formate dehydrogenase, alpha subunit n=1 Tax=Candidatus Nomurabacteria bacterium GW2011_GWA2_40_9 TaxID=1618734 RepID=A0A0G0TPA8_9BACT|nr:MAG: Formate dehydrogenase, alpha subunit [Candidatus Nomurabacteria bacterium GW2011_GWA2_40_9]